MVHGIQIGQWFQEKATFITQCISLSIYQFSHIINALPSSKLFRTKHLLGNLKLDAPTATQPKITSLEIMLDKLTAMLDVYCFSS